MTKHNDEVAELKAIGEERGFAKLTDASAEEGSFSGAEGVSGMAVDGARDGGGIHPQRVRNYEADVEAQWPGTAHR